MNLRKAWTALGPSGSVALATLVLGLTLVACSGDGSGQGGGSGDRSPAGGGDPAIGDALPVKLYFPGPGDRLYPELVRVPYADELEQRVATTIEALLAGPSDESLAPVFEVEVSLVSVFINEDSICYLDLGAAGEGRPPVFGSRQEMLVAYSLVDTVLLNFPEVRSVALLWQGEQRSSFAGHLDTTLPLFANTELVSESR